MPHMPEVTERPVDTATLQKKRSSQVGPPKSSSDDDLSLRVSMYLGSEEGSEEFVEDVAGLVRAYGFTNFVSMFRAPGSFYFSMNVEYHSKDQQEARKNKDELEKDLIKDELPEEPEKAAAVKKVKQSFWSLSKKKVVGFVLFGTTFLGSAVMDLGKDKTKDLIEKELREQGPKVVRMVDGIAASALPAPAAKKFHEAVRSIVDKSPERTSVEPPPSVK